MDIFLKAPVLFISGVELSRLPDTLQPYQNSTEYLFSRPGRWQPGGAGWKNACVCRINLYDARRLYKGSGRSAFFVITPGPLSHHSLTPSLHSIPGRIRGSHQVGEDAHSQSCFARPDSFRGHRFAPAAAMPLVLSAGHVPFGRLIAQSNRGKGILLSFQNLQLADPVLRAIDACGYATPTPVQARSIPEVLAGRDLIASAQTGTGKTAA
ncbi:MAG TPA: DEAD/DEAH box helicase, partial [Desulfuromonadales bacterium]|nr:DEAD/DEAH box helicase [Desulfuromonadales bacterium]